MKMKLFLGVALGMITFAGSAFAANVDYTNYTGESPREFKKIEVVNDSIKEFDECREINCHGNEPRIVKGACHILFSLAYGKGDCNREQECTIHKTYEFLKENGVVRAYNTVCVSDGSGGGNGPDDASALCTDNPAGSSVEWGGGRACFEHGYDQPTP